MSTSDWNRYPTDLHRELARDDERLACALAAVILAVVILGGML